jgi:hypothetical protein
MNWKEFQKQNLFFNGGIEHSVLLVRKIFVLKFNICEIVLASLDLSLVICSQWGHHGKEEIHGASWQNG